MITFKTRLYFTISLPISHSLSGSLRPSPLHSVLVARPLLSLGGERRREVVCYRYLVLEHNAEQLPSQAVGEPRVLDDGHLEALAAEHGVVVGVNGSAHSFDDDQVDVPLPHHHRQHFVQTARGEKIHFSFNQLPF